MVSLVQEVTTRAGLVRYVGDGTGPAVVLLHATLHDHHDFDAVLAGFAASFRTLAPDWPGHGSSPLPAEPPVTATLLGEVLTDFLDALALPRVVLIGSSVGGYAAARVAIERPDRVAGLVLVNSGGCFTPPTRRARAAIRLLGTAPIARRLLPRIIGQYLRPRTSFERELGDRVSERARSSAGSALAAGLWRSFGRPDFDLRRLVAAIAAPVLVVWGTRDRIVTPAMGRQTARAIPGAAVRTLDTGHLPFAGDPEGFLDAVLPFCAAAHGRRADPS